MPERLRGVFTTRRYTNPRLPLSYLRIFERRRDVHTGLFSAALPDHTNLVMAPKS